MRILPTKHLPPERSLLHIGGKVLARLGSGKTVSRLWEEIERSQRAIGTPVTFDWFVLALDVLYAAGAIEVVEGRVIRQAP